MYLGEPEMTEEEKKKDEKQKEDTEKDEKTIEEHAEAAENWISDFFSFKMFITRPFIRIIYVLGVLALLAAGFYMMVKNGQWLMGIVTLTLGNIMWRIICEVEMVVFHMNDILEDMQKELKEE